MTENTIKEKVVKPIYKEVPEQKKESFKKEIVVEVPESKKEENEVEKEKPSLSPQDHYLSDPTFHKVADYFDLSPTQREIEKNKLSVVVDWAVLESNSSDPVEILLTIDKIAKRVGKSVFNESRLRRVYRVVRLMGQKSKLEKEIKIYIKDPKEENGRSDS